MSDYVNYQRAKWEAAQGKTLRHYGIAQLGAWEKVMPPEDTSPELPVTAPSGRTDILHSSTLEDARELLAAAGVGQTLATMAIPYMWFLPRTSDPYAQGVIVVVSGLQRLLNARGASLAIDGGLGRKTVRSLRRYAGPTWYDKTWTQLYGDVLLGEPWKGFQRMGRRQEAALEAMGQTTFVGDFFASPLPYIAAAGAAWWYFTRKKGNR